MIQPQHSRQKNHEESKVNINLNVPLCKRFQEDCEGENAPRNGMVLAADSLSAHPLAHDVPNPTPPITLVHFRMTKL